MNKKIGFWRWLGGKISESVRDGFTAFSEYMLGGTIFSFGIVCIFIASFNAALPFLQMSIFLIPVGFLITAHGWYREFVRAKRLES